MCEHDGVEAYVASRRQFSVSSFHHKVLEPKTVSTLTASALPTVPLRHFTTPQPCTLGVWFWDGVWFFQTSLEFTWPWILTFLSSVSEIMGFFHQANVYSSLFLLRIIGGGGGVSSAKVHIWRSFCSATLFHLWKTADAWSTTILTALLSNLKRASDSWVPGWQVYTATHGCSSCTTPLEFRQSSFQQR